MPNTVLSVKATKCTQPKSIQNNHQYVRILTRMGRSTGEIWLRMYHKYHPYATHVDAPQYMPLQMF